MLSNHSKVNKFQIIKMKTKVAVWWFQLFKNDDVILNHSWKEGEEVAVVRRRKEERKWMEKKYRSYRFRGWTIERITKRVPREPSASFHGHAFVGAQRAGFEGYFCRFVHMGRRPSRINLSLDNSRHRRGRGAISGEAFIEKRECSFQRSVHRIIVVHHRTTQWSLHNFVTRAQTLTHTLWNLIPSFNKISISFLCFLFFLSFFLCLFKENARNFTVIWKF